MAGIRFGKKAQPVTPTLPFVMDPSEIARVAYELYEQRGREDGRDFDDWLRAEAIVWRRYAAQRGVRDRHADRRKEASNGADQMDRAGCVGAVS